MVGDIGDETFLSINIQFNTVIFFFKNKMALKYDRLRNKAMLCLPTSINQLF